MNNSCSYYGTELAPSMSMLDIAQTQSGADQNPALKNKKVLRYREDDRTAGRIPVWDSNKTAKENVSERLALAENNPRTNFDKALAYADSRAATQPDEAFGFGDIVDMANPLHHIPLVGNVYRHVTGDEIKPVSRIIGGAAFGGAAGAAGGLIDTIVKHETGKDITGNVWSMVNGETPQYRTAGLKPAVDEQRTARKTDSPAPNPQDEATIVAMADLGNGRKRIMEEKNFLDGRSAGKTMSIREDMPFLGAKKEPITQLQLSPMPVSYNDYD